MDGTEVSDVAVASGMTVAELHARTDTDDGRRWELIDGELFVSPAPRPGHQEVILKLAGALRAIDDGRRVLIAPVDIQVGSRTVVQPDVVAFSPDDSDTLHPESPPPHGMVPEIAIEVSSPSTRRLDLVHKRRLYERSGVAEYWFVDREAGVVDVYAFGADDDLRTSSGDARVPSDLVELDTTVADLLAW